MRTSPFLLGTEQKTITSHPRQRGQSFLSMPSLPQKIPGSFLQREKIQNYTPVIEDQNHSATSDLGVGVATYPFYCCVCVWVVRFMNYLFSSGFCTFCFSQAVADRFTLTFHLYDRKNVAGFFPAQHPFQPQNVGSKVFPHRHFEATEWVSVYCACMGVWVGDCCLHLYYL